MSEDGKDSLLAEANRDAQNRWRPSKSSYMDDAMTVDEGRSEMGSDGKAPVSQRQLRDHERFDDANRKGDLKLQEERHQQMLKILGEIKEKIDYTSNALEKKIDDTSNSLALHSEKCPAIATSAKNEEEIKVLSKKFWLTVGILAAGGGGAAGLFKLLV